MNSISLIGRITADCELKQTTSGLSVCRFCIAVKRPYVKDKTDFLNCTAWRQTAENICKYFHKGSQIAIVGCLTTDKREIEGKNITFYNIEVNEFDFIDSRTGNSSQVTSSGDGGINTPSEPKTPQNAKLAVTEPRFETIDNDGDLPF